MNKSQIEKAMASLRAARRRSESLDAKLRRKASRAGGRPGQQRRGRATRAAGSWKSTGRTPALLLKLHKGGAAGLAYSSRQKGSHLLSSTCVSHDSQGQLAELALAAARHPGVNPGRMTQHLSLSRPAGHALSPARWVEVIDAFKKEIGASGDHVAIRHTSTKNDHVHLILSRAQADGNLLSDSQNFYKWREGLRRVEKQLGIDVNETPAATPATTDRQVTARRMAARLDKPSGFIAPEVIHKCLLGAGSVKQFSERLAAAGIELKTATSSSGHNTGLLFKTKQGGYLAGSSIAREFSLPKIQVQIEFNQRQQAQARQLAAQQAQAQIQHQQMPRLRGG